MIKGVWMALVSLCVLVLFGVAGQSRAAATLDQSQTSFAGAAEFFGELQYAQTFTAEIDGTLDYVRLHLSKQGDVGDVVTVHVTATSDGKPSGEPLASGTVSAGSILPEGSSADVNAYWVTVQLTPSASTSGTQYAIVVSAPTTFCPQPGPYDPRSSDCAYFVGAGSTLPTGPPYEPGPYAEGNELFSEDGGMYWEDASFPPADDMMFETYVSPPANPCEAGFYSTTGNGPCTLCPVGTTTLATGATACVVTASSLTTAITSFFGGDTGGAWGVIAKADAIVKAPNANAKAGALKAFNNQIDAKIGKTLTAAQGARLKQLAASL